MPGVIQLDQDLDPEHPPFLEVSTPEGILVSGANECDRVSHLERDEECHGQT